MKNDFPLMKSTESLNEDIDFNSKAGSSKIGSQFDYENTTAAVAVPRLDPSLGLLRIVKEQMRIS